MSTKLRVLIAEDDVFQALAAKYFLEGVVNDKKVDTDIQKIDVTVAHCASDAEEYLSGAADNLSPYDILLLDLALPERPKGRDDDPEIGLKLFGFLGKQNTATRVIVVSGFNDFQKHVLPAARLGAADIITKPYEFEKLFRSVERCWNENQSAPVSRFCPIYVDSDKAMVTSWLDKLAAAGYNSWAGPLPGENLDFSTAKALKSSYSALIFLSPKAVEERGRFQKDIKVALDIHSGKLDKDLYLIPVQLESCELPDALQDLHPARIFEEEGWKRLLQALQESLKRNQPTDQQAK